MTTPNEELRRLATAAMRAPDSTSRLIDLERACTPSIILALLDQLQSQAERIKKLEFESSTHLRMRNLHYGENGKLRDQLAAIAATEPVAKLKPCKEGWFIDLDNPPPITGETIELFTSPMPAKPQDHEIRELVDRPAILFKPRLFPAGDQWCALFGEDLQTGVCGFDASAGDAMRDFDKKWNTKLKAGK